MSDIDNSIVEENSDIWDKIIWQHIKPQEVYDTKSTKIKVDFQD